MGKQICESSVRHSCGKDKLNECLINDFQASRWQLCVQFDWPEIWTTDFPLQRRITLYRSTRIYLSYMPRVLPWLVTGYFLTLRKKRWQYQMPINSVSHQQARSQDLKKGGRGLFWKSEKSANDLDPNFHCSGISFTRFVRKLRRNFSEIETFFQPKDRWSPKKKKKGLHRNWVWFFGENQKF